MRLKINMTYSPKLTSVLNKAKSVWLWLEAKFDRGLGRVRSSWPIIADKLWATGAASTLLAAFVLGAAFVWPGEIKYSLANTQNCIPNPVLLPRLVNRYESDAYQLAFSGQRSILGYPLFADKTCAYLKQPVLAGQNQRLKLTHTLLPFAPKHLTVVAPQPTVIELGRPTGLPVSTSGPLVFHLNQSDQTFDYRLNANNKKVVCAKRDAALLCNLDRLDLKQGGRYEFVLERLLPRGPAQEVYKQELTTVEPIVVTKSSIASNQTIQNVPSKLTLTANKTIEGYSELNLYLVEGKQKSRVETDLAVSGRTLEVVFKKPLKRRAEFELRLGGLTAQDGSYLLRPYAFRFRTSGGPRITGANIGSYGVGSGQTITLSLDSEPKPNQNLNKYISLRGNGFKYSLSGFGKQLVLTPVGAWPRCARFNITVSDGLQNRYGVSGGSKWQLNSHTLCQQVSAIGQSVNGRGIYAYKFGGGGSKVIFVGGTHGSEPSSVYTLTSWIDQLEANYDSIPANKTVIVVPDINPDGLTALRRTNARDVDLNRNFPADNWKKDVIMPGGELNKGGGGTAPLSEPESSAIAAYVLGQSPKLILTYHAIGSLVVANESGNSRSLATTYGQHTGYWALGNSEIGGVFSHDTTGAFEDWLHDKYGIPALLIELSSYGGNEFWHHQSAMWAMVKS